MASRSKMPVRLDVTTIEDIAVENGVLDVLFSVKDHGTGQDDTIRLRLDLENAYDLRSRLGAGMVTASNQIHA
jgi:hypothetical protein